MLFSHVVLLYRFLVGRTYNMARACAGHINHVLCDGEHSGRCSEEAQAYDRKCADIF